MDFHWFPWDSDFIFVTKNTMSKKYPRKRHWREKCPLRKLNSLTRFWYVQLDGIQGWYWISRGHLSFQSWREFTQTKGKLSLEGRVATRLKFFEILSSNDTEIFTFNLLTCKFPNPLNEVCLWIIKSVAWGLAIAKGFSGLSCCGGGGCEGLRT